VTSGTHPTRRLRQRFVVPALLVVVAVVLVTIQSRFHDVLTSPGEPAQLDYVLSVPHVPATGDLLSEEAVPVGLTREQVADGPYSFAGATPPAYYVATAAVARPVAAVTGWTPLSVARWLGAAWLALFMLVAFALARRMGVPTFAAAAATTAVAASTSLATSAAYLGSDLAGAAAGGLVLLAAWSYDGSRRALLAVGGACALAGLTKLTAVTAVAAAVVMLLARAVLSHRSRTEGDESRRADALPVGAALLGAAVGAVGFLVPAVSWILRTRATAEVDVGAMPVFAPYVVDSIDWHLYVEGLFYPWLSPVVSSWVTFAVIDPPELVLIYLLLALFPLGVLGAAFTTGRPRLAGLGIGLAVAMVAGPFAFLETNFLLNGLLMPVEPRYGLGLLAGATAAVAWLFRNRGGAWVLVVVTAFSLLNLLT
jgi:hypothetical protein